MKHYEIGDKCPDKNCKGVFQEQDNDSCCSCHIHPPCSHCVDMILECDECSFEYGASEEYESAPKHYDQPSKGDRPAYYKQKTMEDLTKGTFDYLTFAGAYYSMTYRGYYPKGWDVKKLISQFNVCFGYADFSMKDGYFNIKVYTD